MNMHDWSLILYTLCLQSAVGIYVVSRIVLWNEESTGARMRFLHLALALGVAGVIASVTHLGYPANALKTMSNLGTSWLSREILLTALFGAAGIGSVLLERGAVGSVQTRNGWAALTSLLGLGLIYVMSMIYRSSAFPAWEHVSTTLVFFATAGLVGTAAVFAGQCVRKGEEEPRGLGGLVIGAAAMLGLQVAALALHGAYLGTAGPEAQATAALMTGQWSALYWGQILCLVLGAGICMPLAWQRVMQKKAASLPQFAGALVALVALGELAGRVVFYATRVKIGL
ncbi:anaerobic dimethyl sulfoxide reductase subunit C (anchor subunit) [Symbiobacterium terraclitae]|uniref:Anaerobic dimethyl sulfoxide reductase subunit C (Anchor subunit) n=2 Tax=Symbiobacterium terraclitae TaxID=557451 RepID=A0ABS4JV12_9FIRM|nr:anaerobic dimethyl sulfoxide reductase subunit C (anchor subunit) [Symbiobacterium terraclitae]